MDLRVHSVPAANQGALVQDLASALGEEFDVIWEDKNGPNAHVHIEYDP